MNPIDDVPARQLLLLISYFLSSCDQSSRLRIVSTQQDGLLSALPVQVFSFTSLMWKLQLHIHAKTTSYAYSVFQPAGWCCPALLNTQRLTVFGGEDFLVCDQFLTKTHHKVDVLRSSALCLLPLLVIPVVYSAETKEENTCQSVVVTTSVKFSVRGNDDVDSAPQHKLITVSH